MKKYWIILTNLILVVIIVIGSGGIVIGSGGDEDEVPLQKIRFAHYGLDSFRDVFVAQEKGFFKANGVDVELVKTLATNVAPAMAGGRTDGGVLNDVAALPSAAKGVDIKFVLQCIEYIRQEQLPYICVLNDSPIKTIKDLDGKTVAGHLKGSGVWLWVQIAMKEHGIKFSRYLEASVALGQSVPVLLAKKQVDSAVMWPSTRLVRLKDKNRAILPLNAVTGMGLFYCFSGEFIRENPDAVRRFIAALKQAREYEKDHPIEVLRITGKYSFFTFEDMKALREANGQFMYPPKMVLQIWKLENTMDAMLEFGMLKKRFDIKKHVDTRFVTPEWEMPEHYLDWLPK